MNSKRALATAMSALMIISSTPTSALAAELGQGQSAAPAAVAAGLKSAPDGEKSLRDALAAQSGTKAETKPAEKGTAAKDDAAAAKAATTGADKGEADNKSGDKAAANEKAAETDAAATTVSPKADAAATAAATPKADAAADGQQADTTDRGGVSACG